MRICHVADGQSVHTKRWIEWSQDEGHEVHLITDVPTDIENVKVHFLQERKGLLSFILRAYKTRKLVKMIRPDIVHAHYVFGYGFFAAFSGFHPLVISALGSDILIDAKGSTFKRIVSRYALRRADAVTTTSRFIAGNVRSVHDASIHIVPYGVDLNLFFPKRKKRVMGAQVIGFVKALERVYGCKYLIGALPDILEKHPDLKVYIIGDGSHMDDLKGLVRNLDLDTTVQFKGMVPHEDIPRYLDEMDVFVMPSLSEGFGVSALEAQAMGVPVVATNVGGIPEVVEDGVSGILVEPRSHREIAEAVVKLLNDEKLRIRMGEKGRESVQKKYDWSENTKDMGKLYKTLCDDISRKNLK
ncbi:MAG: glycosyltransferase [Thermoplasmata archaeon]|nr:glycosyltransferase [Thermoplasmata archaeon]